NPSGKLWPASMRFTAKADPLRWNPAVHVNQTGYLPDGAKQAMVGFYLGTLGEMTAPDMAITDSPPASLSFKIVEAHSSKEVFQGRLKPRPDRGFDSYQQVLEADFTDLKTAGEYRLLVPGLGTSFPFLIDYGVVGAFARTYAL